MTTSESSKAGEQGSGARAITRGEEARVREAVMRALALQDFTLAWNDDDTLWAISGWTGAEKATGAIERERLATEGIVPGPAGWCWAAAPATRYSCRWNERCTFADKHSGPCSCDGEGQGAPPAWLTAEVLAALPADGTPVGFDAIEHAVDPLSPLITRARIEADLAHLVSTGEIETGEQPGTWRRWGVPEGWAWRRNESDGQEHLVGIIAGEVVAVATAFPNGGWRAGISSRHNVASPPTLAAARSAALRACHERGVFTEAAPSAAPPKPVPSPPATRPQPEGRPARLRAALLAVLTPGPVRTTAALLPALDAAMGERAGVAVATGAEARQAAREVGARVDGVEWSLPAVPDGWGWRSTGDGLNLTPLDSLAPMADAVASVSPSGLFWRTYEPGPEGMVIENGDSGGVEEGRALSLKAARLAGLFAAPRAEAAPVAAPAPTTPLDALARRLCGAHLYAAGSPGMAAVEADVAALTPLLAAFRADAVAASLARTIDHYAAERAATFGGTVADWRDLRDPSTAHLVSVWQAAQRVDDARSEGGGEFSGALLDLHSALADGARVPDGAALLAAALDAYAAHKRARSAPLASEELSNAEADVARSTGALFDLLDGRAGDAPTDVAADAAADARHAQRRVEGERDAALARAGLDAADRATLDAVGRLREALTALCAGPGAWRWAVDESAPDAAARLIGVMASRIADFETVQRVADAHRQEMRASRDAALAELTRVREGIAAVMGAIAGGREVGK